MRLVLAVDSLTPELTGIGRYTWELASRLPPLLGTDQVRYYRQGRWVKVPGQLLQPSPSPKSSRHRGRPCWRLRMPDWVRQHGLKWACRGQIFHGPNFFVPPCADIGVATVHDLSVFKFPETHPVARVKQFEREFECSLSRASHLITASETTRKEVMEFSAWPGEKITVVPFGVSSTFAPKSESELAPCMDKYGLIGGAYALCVSTLEPRKRIGNLLRAYQCLPRRLRNRYPLILVGSAGWLSEALREEIERVSRQGWLRYLGFVPEADLAMLYAGARAFIYPSSYEGFGLPVLEAMASGIPVVASNRSSLPEVTQGAALLLDPDDVDAMAGTIRTGLSDEAWRSTARSKGLTVAQAYSWNRCIEQTVRVYEGVAR
ncbi:MAG: glycosyltransferase family 4 protein [Hyphomicrobiales bacterium]